MDRDEIMVSISQRLLEEKNLAFVRGVRQFFTLRDGEWIFVREESLDERLDALIKEFYLSLLADGDPVKVRLALELLEESFKRSVIAFLKDSVSAPSEIFLGYDEAVTISPEAVFAERERRRELRARNKRAQEEVVEEEEVFEEN